MNDFERLVQASRLYYELGETQSAVAERLGVTRPQVSRLLKQARAEGIVEIRIVDRVTAESAAGDILRRRFDMDAVHLAPTIDGPEDLTRRMVGRLAAQVLRGVIRDGDTVGIGDGASIGAVADALEDVATPVAATIVPLAGGYWSPFPGREPFRRIADAFGAVPHSLMVPGLLDDSGTARALGAHAGVQAVRDLWGQLDVAIYGIGGRSWGVASVGADVAEQLEASGAVGEILIAPYDLDGSFVCPDLRDRVLAFDARRLGRVPKSIGIAAGGSKIQPILGALRTGTVRILVTDVSTAEAVVELDAETRGPEAAP